MQRARNQWGLTPIDSLSTAIVMNDEDIVNQILDFIPTVDFSTTRKPNEPISLFESTIRYLGGLLSSMEIISLPGTVDGITARCDCILHW
jgi:mannosyl-oligosaccharide alpha-1,2-mannosidase